MDQKCEISVKAEPITASLTLVRVEDIPPTLQQQETKIVKTILIVAALIAATANTGWADDMLRIKLSMDEFGNCTMSVESTGEPLEKATEFEGEVTKSSRLPKTQILKNIDGLVRLLHDFSKPDEFDVLFTGVLGEPVNARLDERLKSLTLTSNQQEESKVMYGRRLKPPFTIVCDSVPMLDDMSLRLFLDMQLSNETREFLVVHVLTYGRKDNSTAKVGAYWMEGSKDDSRRTQLLDPTDFELGKGISKQFRLPVPNARLDARCFIGLQAKSKQHAVQQVTGLSITGRISSFFGIGFDQQRGLIFAKHMVKGGPAESAGIRSGDVIISINGKRPTSIYEAVTVLSETPFGDNATLEIERAGKTSTISIKSE